MKIIFYGWRDIWTPGRIWATDENSLTWCRFLRNSTQPEREILCDRLTRNNKRQNMPETSKSEEQSNGPKETNVVFTEWYNLCWNLADQIIYRIQKEKRAEILLLYLAFILSGLHFNRCPPNSHRPILLHCFWCPISMPWYSIRWSHHQSLHHYLLDRT